MVTMTVRPLRDTFFTDLITMAAALASNPAHRRNSVLSGYFASAAWYALHVLWCASARHADVKSIDMPR